MLRIVFLDKIPEYNFKFDFPFIMEEYENCPNEQVSQAIEKADIVIVNKIPLTYELMKNAKQLKLIAICATGFNHVDVKAARDLNISVCNVKSYSTNSVAEHAFAMLLQLSHNFKLYQEQLSQWSKSTFFTINTKAIIELKGQNLAIIGKGDIGNRLAHFAKTFEMNVYFSERKNAKTIREGYISFSEALKIADVLSLHCPLNDETYNLINEKELSQMKSNAILLNLSRGGLVNEKALVNALNNKIIAGAGFDVLAKESPPSDNPLINYQGNNLILTPHIAWKSNNSIETLIEIMQNNINGFVANKPQNIVN